MNVVSNKSMLVALGVTAFVTSRTTFFFIDDPEGPNLLIVSVLAAVLFGVSMSVFWYKTSLGSRALFMLAVVLQVVTAVVLYFLFR